MKKSKSSKDAKFFCECCGSEVARNAKTCPFCGKFFASVRCPKCGNTGSTEEFAKGCPACGYAVNPQFGNRNNSYFNGMNNVQKSNKNKSFLFNIFNKNRNNSSREAASIPIWIYIVCLVILGILVTILYSCLR